MNKFDTLDNVVIDICSNLGDNDGRMYIEIMRLVRRALDELQFTTMPTFKSILFEMKDNYTIELPDYVKGVTKVAYCDGERIIHLGNKKFLERPDLAVRINSCTCTESEATDLLKETDTTVESYCSNCCFHNYWHNGRFGEVYGLTPKSFEGGNWRYDYERNRIVFDSGTQIKPGNEYLCECEVQTGNEKIMLIPRDMYQTVRYRVLQHYYEGKGFVGQAQAFLKQFRASRRMYAKKFSKYSSDDWRALFYRTWHNSIKL